MVRGSATHKYEAGDATTESFNDAQDTLAPKLTVWQTWLIDMMASIDKHSTRNHHQYIL